MAPESLWWCSHGIKDVCSLEENLSILKSRNITLLTKVCIVKAMVFSIVMYRYESWTIRKAECRRIDAFDLWCWGRLLISLNKEIKPVNPKGNKPWIFIGRTDAEVEAPILWPPDAKSWPIGKDPDAGKDWRQEERGMTEDEMVGWHHGLNGHEFAQTLGDGEGQGSLVCYIQSMGSQRVGRDWVTEQQQVCKLILMLMMHIENISWP